MLDIVNGALSKESKKLKNYKFSFFFKLIFLKMFSEKLSKFNFNFIKFNILLDFQTTTKKNHIFGRHLYILFNRSASPSLIFPVSPMIGK